MRETDLHRIFRKMYGYSEECIERLCAYIGGREDLPFPEIEALVNDLPLDKEPLFNLVDAIAGEMSDQDISKLMARPREKVLKQLDRMDEEERL